MTAATATVTATTTTVATATAAGAWRAIDAGLVHKSRIGIFDIG